MIAVALVAVAACVLLRPWEPAPRVPSVGGPAPRPSSAVEVGGPAWGVAIGVAAMVAPLLVVPVVAGPTVRALLRRRREPGVRDRAVLRALPDTLDLLVIGVTAGLTARAAVQAAAPWVPEPIGSALRQALARSDRGEPLAVALAATCRPLGDPMLPLVSLLGEGTGDRGAGARLPALIRLGDEVRRRRRADAQERARRLPVAMLLPLVCCVLPAFVLVGIVPLVLASVGGIGLDP